MTYKNESFEEFLGRMHMENEPMVLDDDISDAFDAWLGDLDVELTIIYAEKWHLEQQLADLNAITK